MTLIYVKNGSVNNVTMSYNSGPEDVNKTIYTDESETIDTNSKILVKLRMSDRFIFDSISQYPDDFSDPEIIENDNNGNRIKNSSEIELLMPIDTQSPTWYYEMKTIKASDRTEYGYKETLINCTSSLTGKNTIEKSTIITFTADEGYKFIENGHCVIDRSPYPDYEFDFPPTNEKTFDLDISKETNINGNVAINLTADKESVETISNFVNVYLTNNQELGQLSLERFIEKTGENNYDYYDYGRNILNLIKIPFSVDSLINRKTNIKLGKYESKTESTLLSNYILIVEIGNITVPLKYNDFRDYTNVNFVLHLPYLEQIEIEPQYCIDKTISIKYKIDLYSGQVACILYNDNQAFYSKSTTISQEIPFIQLTNGSDNNNIKILLDNDIRTAYIEAIRNEVIVNEFGADTNETGQLNNYHGYTQVSNIILYTKAPYNEQNEIKQLLQQGVILP